MLNTLKGAGNRMQTTQILASPGKRHINGFTGEFLLDGGALKVCTAGVDSLLHLPLGVVDLLAGGGTFFRRQLTQCLRLLGDHTLLAKVFNTNLIQCLQTVGTFNRRQAVLNELIQVFH